LYQQVERLEIILSAQTEHSGVIRLLKKMLITQRILTDVFSWPRRNVFAARNDLNIKKNNNKI